MANIKKPVAKVISFPNEYMRDVMAPFLIQMGNAINKSSNDQMKFDFIQSAIDFMRFVKKEQLPTGVEGEPKFKVPLTVSVNGRLYTKEFELIKKLHKENIYELRIDFDRPPFYWRLRIIFFPYVHNGDLFHCLLFPLQKNPMVRKDMTNLFRDRAEKVYKDLQISPGKYSDCFK